MAQTAQNGRYGSAMSAKQLARTVVDGRAVVFKFQDGTVQRGYLCGMDDFHWMIVTPEGAQHLVHKGSAPLITLEESVTYEAEAKKDVLEAVVGPFREWVTKTYLAPQREERPT